MGCSGNHGNGSIIPFDTNDVLVVQQCSHISNKYYVGVQYVVKGMKDIFLK